MIDLREKVIKFSRYPSQDTLETLTIQLPIDNKKFDTIMQFYGFIREGNARKVGMACCTMLYQKNHDMSIYVNLEKHQFGCEDTGKCIHFYFPEGTKILDEIITLPVKDASELKRFQEIMKISEEYGK